MSITRPVTIGALVSLAACAQRTDVMREQAHLPAVAERGEAEPRAAAVASPPTPTPEVAERPKPRVVLHIGDSMVGYGHGLSLAMTKRYAAARVEYHWDAWTSAQVQTIDGKRMDKLLAAYKPDLVLFNLGTNNLSVPHPEALADGIRALARHLAEHGRTCVWIAPIRPKWKYNPKVYDVLKENVAPCKYFDAGDLDPPLQTDHIHPTDAGGEQWAASLWDFLRDV